MSVKKVLVSAGGTLEPIDDIRFVSNVSTGKLGMRITAEFLKAGFKVTLLLKSGPVLDISSLKDPPLDFSSRFLEVIRFTSAEDLYCKMKKLIESKTYSIVVHSAAVADYTPVKVAGKIPSGGKLEVQFLQTKKIIKEIKDWDSKVFLASFKLEVSVSEEKLVETALQSLRNNHSDLVVANDLSLIKQGNHRGLLISKNGLERVIEGKENIAWELVRYIRERIGNRGDSYD